MTGNFVCVPIRAGAKSGRIHFYEPWMNEINLDTLESMERILEKRAEQALVIIILSMATLVACLGFLVFH
jgi:hypothetical protein